MQDHQPDYMSAVSNKFEDVSRYADIIGRGHHVSKSRPHMPNAERAAQFSPFAALAGHDEAIRETVLRAQRRVENEIEKEQL